MTRPRAVGLGSGGHARVVIEILQIGGVYEIVGLLEEDASHAGTVVMGVPVLGSEELLDGLVRDGVDNFFIGVGSTSNSGRRRRLYEVALERGLRPISATHPRAVVSSSATVSPGTMIMAGAILNPGVRVGCNVIVNTGALVEHDCGIGDHAHVATGARLAGGVRIGTGAHVGAGAPVRQGLLVGEDSVVGAGAVVVTDVPPRVVVVGVPAKVLRSEGSSRVTN